jgi:hypothetical protein
MLNCGLARYPALRPRNTPRPTALPYLHHQPLPSITASTSSAISITTSNSLHASVYLSNCTSAHAHAILVNRPPLIRPICLPGVLPQSAILTVRPSTLRVGFAITRSGSHIFGAILQQGLGSAETVGLVVHDLARCCCCCDSQGCSLRPTRSKPG